jgi:hypothetical protein
MRPRSDGALAHKGLTVAMCFLFCVTLLAAPSAFAGDRLVTGQYEITSTANGKPQNSTYCVTPEMAKHTSGSEKEALEYAQTAGKGICTIKDFTLTGDTISYKMECSGGTRETIVHATYHGDHFEGDMTTAAHGTTVVLHTTAKRVGACKE